MFLRRWLQQVSEKTAARPRGHQPAFRPTLESLGDRITPHGGPVRGGIGGFLAPEASVGSLTPVWDSTAATHFAVFAQPQAYAGADARLTVVALDALNRPVPGYTGTVHFTGSDSAATLPADYTFTAADRGRHTFTVTPAATGTLTVTATDTATASVTGSAAINVETAPVATHFFVQTERDVYTGTATRVVVAALDASNRPVSNYTGTVHFTSTDPNATLPADYTFTADDRGVKVFTFTPAAAGSLTLTATDTANASLTGAATATVTPAPVATHFAVQVRRAAVGAAAQVVVVALDANNRPVPNYTGTVKLTSSDTAATLPADYTFTAADRGVKVFTVTFGTTGSQTLTAADTTDAAITGTANVSVGTEPVHPMPGHAGFFPGRRR